MSPGKMHDLMAQAADLASATARLRCHDRLAGDRVRFVITPSEQEYLGRHILGADYDPLLHNPITALYGIQLEIKECV